MWVRDATPADAGALAAIYYRAVQIGAAEVYSEKQRDAWAGQQPTPERWAERLNGLLTLVADTGTAPIGFMSLRLEDGYLDLAFVDPDHRRTGVSRDIYAVLENRARAAGLTHLSTHASHMAKRFFQREGWQVVNAALVKRGDVTLENWVMEKALT